MEVKFTPKYSCQLVLDLEKERQRVFNQAMHLTISEQSREDFEAYSMRFYVTKYCQMGVNRRWYDFQKEVRRNIYAIDAGKIDEVTMPELITDVDAWSDEDKLVYKALKEAEMMKVKK